MVLGWVRRRRNGSGTGKIIKPLQLEELKIPNHFRCPISLDLMKDPVTISSGVTYDRDSIERWLLAGNFTCPVTEQVLLHFDQVPNHSLRQMIQEWCVHNNTFRIPTPRVPLSPARVSDLLSWIPAASDPLRFVLQVKNWCTESDRDRRCVVSAGAPAVLAAAFHAFSAADDDNDNDVVLEEILSALNKMYPLDTSSREEEEVVIKHLGSEPSLRCMVRFLESPRQNVNTKQNTILALQELLSSAPHVSETLSEIEGAKETLVKLIQEPINPQITNASLGVVFNIVSNSSTATSSLSFVEMGLVSRLVEMGTEVGDKKRCERAVGILDRLCDVVEGRREACRNALTVPMLVKKILRVSEAATQFSISAMWKLCGERDNEGVVAEALEVGAFQKLLLVVQLGCTDETKEKATHLLKLFNPYRLGLECIDSLDFKNLKRSF